MIWTLLGSFPRYLYLCLVNLPLIICPSGQNVKRSRAIFCKTRTQPQKYHTPDLRDAREIGNRTSINGYLIRRRMTLWIVVSMEYTQTNPVARAKYVLLTLRKSGRWFDWIEKKFSCVAQLFDIIHYSHVYRRCHLYSRFHFTTHTH